MIERTSKYLVPFVLGTAAMGMLFLAGCKPEEPQGKPAIEADSPEVYMKDKAFMDTLEKQNDERSRLAGVRARLMEEVAERVAAMRAKMPSADDAAVKKELEKDPAWVSLVKRLEDANAAFEDNRQATTKIVSERISPRPVAEKK